MSKHIEPRDLALFLVDTPDEDAKARAAAALYRHNIEKTGIADCQPIGAKLVDARTGELCGGLWGRTEDVRGRGYGARL